MTFQWWFLGAPVATVLIGFWIYKLAMGASFIPGGKREPHGG